MHIRSEFIKLVYGLFQILNIISKTGINADLTEYTLMNDLFQNYNPKVRPSINHTQQTMIYITLAMGKILEIDEKNQILSTYSWILMGWYDLSLSWNLTKYDGITEIVVPANSVWKPDIILSNAAEKIDLQNDHDYVRIGNNGVVAWTPSANLKTQCAINIKYFPFDVQNCSISFTSTTYFSTQIDFTITNDLLLIYYSGDNQWNLKSYSSSKIQLSDPFPMIFVRFNLTFERKPLFFLFNLILPCILILAVAFLAFVVPLQSGEKMSIGITTLLSLSVLLLVVADKLPATSDSIPLLSLFYATSTLIVGCISLCSVVTLNIHHYGEWGKPVPKLIQKLIFTKFAKIVLFPRLIDLDYVRSIKSESQEQTNQNVFEAVTCVSRKNTRYCCPKLFKGSLFRKTKSVIIEQADGNSVVDKEIVQLQWTLLADIADRLLFYIFLIVTIVSLSCVIRMAPNASLNL